MRDLTPLSDLEPRLIDAAAQINAISEALDQTIIKLESWLAGFNIGVSAWHNYKTSTGHEWLIGYAKWEGAWGLLLRERNLADDPKLAVTWRMRQGPRVNRVEALAQFDQLVLRLLQNTEEFGALTVKRNESLVKWLEESGRVSRS